MHGIEDLAHVMARRRAIGEAVGVVMMRTGADAAEATERLSRLADDLGRPVAELAADVVLLREFPS